MKEEYEISEIRNLLHTEGKQNMVKVDLMKMSLTVLVKINRTLDTFEHFESELEQLRKV